MINRETNQLCKIAPRFFYGYIVVVAAIFIMMVSFGPYGAFGVFFKPLLAEFGWTRAMTSGAYSLSMILHGVLGIIMGGIADRFGPRLVVTFCGFFLGLGYLLMSQVGAVWQLYLFYGVIIAIGMSGVWVPLMSAVARWFVMRRSLMTGIVVAGAGTGGLIAPPVISRLIAVYDWRLSYVILGSIVLLIMVLAAQFLRREPAQMGQLPYGGGDNEEKQKELESQAKGFSLKEVVYTTQFWLVFIILSCFGFCMIASMVHIVPHATDLGISAVSAANILAVMGGIGIPGNYVLGSVADRIGNRRVFIICFIAIAATFFLLLLARELWMLYLFAVIFGFALGGMSASESPLVASLFGLSSHGLIYGVLSMGFTVGASVGPFLTGYIFDVTGSYQLAFLVCIAIGIIGIILAAVLRPTKRIGGRI